MPSLFKPVESRRLYQQIADQIRELIDRGGFEAGTRLPPERDLAQQLGVSRPSLREALIALDVEGRVEVRSGSGVYVSAAKPGPAPGRTVSMGESPSQLMEARSVIEGELVVLACARILPVASASCRARSKGVPTGTTSPCQSRIAAPGQPSSASVGTCGSRARRSCALVASARRVPA